MEVGVSPEVASPMLNLSLEEDSALVTSAFQVCAFDSCTHLHPWHPVLPLYLLLSRCKKEITGCSPHGVNTVGYGSSMHSPHFPVNRIPVLTSSSTHPGKADSHPGSQDASDSSSGIPFSPGTRSALDSTLVYKTREKLCSWPFLERPPFARKLLGKWSLPLF